jgi:hypothetical protein
MQVTAATSAAKLAELLRQKDLDWVEAGHLYVQMHFDQLRELAEATRKAGDKLRAVNGKMADLGMDPT